MTDLPEVQPFLWVVGNGDTMHCATNRVWRGRRGMFCHGCGHEVDPPVDQGQGRAHEG